MILIILKIKKAANGSLLYLDFINSNNIARS